MIPLLIPPVVWVASFVLGLKWLLTLNPYVAVGGVFVVGHFGFLIAWIYLSPTEIDIPDRDYTKFLLADRGDGVNMQSVKVAGGSGSVRRANGHAQELLRLPFPDEPTVNTLTAILERSVKRFAPERMLGQRRPPVATGGEFGDFEWTNYADAYDRMYHVGCGVVRSFGGWLKKQSKVGIYSKNCVEMALTIHGVQMAGMVVVPLYDTLGADAVSYIVEHAETSVVFVSRENLPTLVDACARGECSCVRTIVAYQDPGRPTSEPEVASELGEQRARLSAVEIDLVRFDEIEKRGGEGARMTPPVPEDLAFIMYTSGTTGVPKGVPLTHAGFVATVAGLNAVVPVHPGDVHISYLPLAHGFENAVQCCGVASGACVGFYRGNVKTLIEDVAVLRPTVFIGVPRVYQRVQQVVLQTFKKKPWIVRKLIFRAVREQTLAVREGGRSALWDRLVFRQVKGALGGRVRVMCTGAAPLSPGIQEFLRVCFGVPVVEGYGMTETHAVTHATLTSDSNIGSVGPPLPCCEMRLESVPDMNYTADDTPCPRGEVLVRGPNIFRGYYKLPKETAEALTDDGWLRTGDIGRFNPNGTLSIIDRKKNIFKLAQGEYIAAERIEEVLMRCPFVGQIMVHGDSFKTRLVAVVVPDPLELIPFLHKLADFADKDVPVLSKDLQSWLPRFAELCREDALNKLLKQAIEAAAERGRLRHFEHVAAIHVEGALNELMQGFSVANDCLTPTFKLKRPSITRRYAADIDRMYTRLGE